MARSEIRARSARSQGASSSARLRPELLPLQRFDLAAAAQSRSHGKLSFPPPLGSPIPPSTQHEAIRFLLNHATHGFTVTDYAEALGMGYDQWLEWQLDYENVDDTAVDNALASFPTLTMTNDELWQGFMNDATTVVYELQQANLLRAIYSRRQLFERMVEFWTDHFNINQLDDFCLWFKTRDEARVIRKNALGTFPEMLRESPKSAAMLWYLDNYINIDGAVQENYARELMELHTLGVDGPYTEQDIVEVARCFTGWTFGGIFTGGPIGKFVFLPQYHDNGAKTVLGQNIPAGGGESDGDQVLDILAMHPKTAEYISKKMARWLLTYDPPKKLVNRLVDIYLTTGGSIRPMVKEIFSHEWQRKLTSAERTKFKRPYHLTVSMMRAAQVSSTNLLYITFELQRLGQVPYWWGTPDGYPDTTLAWGKALLPRWETASLLFANDIFGNPVEYDTLLALMATAPPGSTTAQAIDWVMTGGASEPSYVDEVQAYIDTHPDNPKVVLREAFALIASSPSFQNY